MRYRLLTWLNDHKRLVAAASDGESDREVLTVLTADGSAPPRALDDLDVGRVVDLEVAPTGQTGRARQPSQRAAASSISSGETPTLRAARSQSRTGASRAWPGPSTVAGWRTASPDTPQTMAIKLGQIETGETTQVATRPTLRDTRPAFDPEGKYLYFIGQRDFDPVYDELHFDLGFPKGSRPFAITLRKDLHNPFIPRPQAAREPGSRRAQEGRGRGRRRPRRRASRSTSTASPTASLAFPVPEARYGRIEGIKGKALFSTLSDRGRARATASRTTRSRAARSSRTTSRRRSRSAWSTASPTSGSAATARRCCTGRAIGCACSRPAKRRPTRRTTSPGRESGWIDLGRVKVSIQPAAEWRQMFQEAWRLQREQFWTEDLSGIDWDAVHGATCRWSIASPRARSSPTCCGRCRASSARRTPTRWAASIGPGPNYRQGFLGRRLGLRRERGRVPHRAHRRAATRWDPTATSPLTGPGVNVRRRRRGAGHQRPATRARRHARRSGWSTRPATRCC